MLAHYLRGLGVAQEELVAISMERSLDMIVGILGILKSGGAYVPLDPAYPKERLAFMMGDAQVRVVVTQQHFVEALPANDTTMVCLDTDWDQIAQERLENPHRQVAL